MVIPKDIKDFPSKEPAEGYWAALGGFIHEFSQVERMLQMLLRHHAGVSPDVAKSIFSGARGDTCKDFINRICEATGRDDVKERLEAPFAQLGHIATARNAIVHWGASTQPDNSVVALNDFLASTPSRLKSIPASPETLRDMTYDLMIINIYLGVEVARKMPRVRRGTLEDLQASIARSEDTKRRMGVTGPWLYTPPQPYPQRTSTRARRRERRRRSPASDE